MVLFESLIQFILHIDSYLFYLIAQYGHWAYLFVFLVIFCETGLVITPFLPGDSLVFTLGSIAAQNQSSLHILILLPLLIIASILGNQTNYWIGARLGPQLLEKPTRRWLNRQHLEKTHQFFEKHGGKTIIMARFIPIIRTFAPFVSGMSHMSPKLFQWYNIISAVLWIGSLLGLGYFLGSLPLIKDNFLIVIYGIIVLSLLPPICSFIFQKMAKIKKI